MHADVREFDWERLDEVLNDAFSTHDFSLDGAIARMFSEGMSPRQIAHEVGLSETAVYKRMQLMNLSPVKVRRRRILDARARGLSPVEIAKEVRCSPVTVRRALRRAGL